MSLTLIGLLVAAAIIVSWLQWQRSGRILALLAGALFLAVGCVPIPSVLLSHLQSG